MAKTPITLKEIGLTKAEQNKVLELVANYYQLKNEESELRKKIGTIKDDKLFREIENKLPPTRKVVEGAWILDFIGSTNVSYAKVIDGLLENHPELKKEVEKLRQLNTSFTRYPKVTLRS